jgi:phage gp45-like
MITAEDLALIRAEIRKQVNVVLGGRAANATGKTEDVQELFAAMPAMEKRPIAHPFGFVSRAKKDTPSLVVRRGEHPNNRVVIGHFDDNRPSLDKEGEVMLYNAFGQELRLKDGKIVVGKTSPKKAARKGDEVKVNIPIGAVVIAVASGVRHHELRPIECTGTITGGSTEVEIGD